MWNSVVILSVLAKDLADFARNRHAFFLSALICVHLRLIAPAHSQTQPAEIPRDELIKLYQAELKDKFDESKFDELYKAHRLIEQFFAERDSKQRTKLIEELVATKVDAAIIGRLCRIRLGWPALPGGVYYINERIGPHNVAYFLGIPPNYSRSRSWPLAVRFPRADAFAKNPPPDQQQVAKIYTDWINDDLKQHPDAIVLMPLLNFDHLFGPGYPGMNAVMQPIFHSANRVNIDPARVYLIGHSMGGHAAWNLALHYPTYFAAFNAMGASAKNEFQRLRLRNLRNTWPVVWHDADDEVIKVDSARQLARALRGQKIDIDYEETKNLGHSPPQTLVAKMYTKLRGRSRELYPKEVFLQSNRIDPIFNRVDWLQVDQPARIGEDQRVFFTLGTEKMTLQSTSWSAKAVLLKDKNRIDLTLDNVELARIFLNDQMIDFDRAMSISINGRVRFEGFAKPDIAAMMNDQLFVGRGWRYFPAVLPIDLNAATTKPATRPK